MLIDKDADAPSRPGCFYDGSSFGRLHAPWTKRREDNPDRVGLGGRRFGGIFRSSNPADFDTYPGHDRAACGDPKRDFSWQDEVGVVGNGSSLRN
jgi:hypothetical protein